MITDDAIPEPIVLEERSKRKTTEFCTAQCEGHRCMLVKGHDGAHEAVAKQGSLRWRTASDD